MNLAKVISKLSPLLGNMIEFNTVEVLNAVEDFHQFGKWVRQDPDFPDTVLLGTISPTPGFEIKAWFPMATEITARFKDSQNHFINDNTYVAMLAWLPERVIFGKPKIIGVCIASGKSVSEARDTHYHDPPDYLVSNPRTHASGRAICGRQIRMATSFKALQSSYARLRSWSWAGVEARGPINRPSNIRPSCGNYSRSSRIGWTPTTRKWIELNTLALRRSKSGSGKRNSTKCQ